MTRALLACLLVLICAEAQAESPRHAVVLGVDGLDPQITRELLERGLLPNIKRVMAGGGFMPLTTANPPQSPVAALRAVLEIQQPVLQQPGIQVHATPKRLKAVIRNHHQ